MTRNRSEMFWKSFPNPKHRHHFNLKENHLMKWKFSGKHFQKLVKMHSVWPSFSEMYNETTQSGFITFMWNLKLELFL